MQYSRNKDTTTTGVQTAHPRASICKGRTECVSQNKPCVSRSTAISITYPNLNAAGNIRTNASAHNDAAPAIAIARAMELGKYGSMMEAANGHGYIREQENTYEVWTEIK